jgi:carboxymethylenebutenolidase
VFVALSDYLIEEVALDCAEGLLTRREALRRLSLLGVSAATATTLLAACGSDDAASPPSSVAETAATSATSPTTAVHVQTSGTSPSSSAPVGSTAARISGEGEEIRFPGPNGELIGLLALAETPKGSVLVIHENRGLTAHIRSIPPRLAADGYHALAIDLLSEEGGTAGLGDDGAATAALGAASADRLIADLRAGLDELSARSPATSLAAIGFCFGGGMTWKLLAAGEPRLAAAVPFYGPLPDGADFSGSKAAVLGVYAGLDNRVNASRDAATAALEAAGLQHEIRTFDNVDHAFFNDTGARYNADAAAEAYAAMLAWFATYLG